MSTADKEENILAFVWGGIGNMVMALPMLRALRQGRPRARISLAVQSGAMAELLESNTYYKCIVLSEKAHTLPLGLAMLARQLRSAKPDIALSSVPWPERRYRLLARMSGARKILALPGGRQAFMNNYRTGKRHNIELNLEVAALAGGRAVKGEARINKDIIDADFARELINTVKKKESRSVVGLHPGAGDTRKRFSRSLFVDLGRLLARAGHAVAVVGGDDEQDLKQDVAAGIGQEARAMPPGLSLRQTLGVIKSCALFVANDSGLAHCAAGLGVPTAVLFGPTDPRISGPRGPKVNYICGGARCRPCYLPAGRYGCSKSARPCLSLTADEVLEQMDSDMKKIFSKRP